MAITVSDVHFGAWEGSPTYEKVQIEKADNGFIVKVGCKTLVAKTWAEVSKGLDEYWKDPSKAQKKYCKE